MTISFMHVDVHDNPGYDGTENSESLGFTPGNPGWEGRHIYCTTVSSEIIILICGGRLSDLQTKVTKFNDSCGNLFTVFLRLYVFDNHLCKMAIHPELPS